MASESGQFSESDDALDAYDELVMAGHAPDPVAFAAKYPEDAGLVDRIRRLEALRGELDSAVRAGAQWPKVVGGYTLGAMLGEGGMGAVFEVVGKPYAVKVLRSESAIALQRFEREAEIAQTLTHPGIARMIAYGVEHGRAYLVSERINGRTLKDVRDASVVQACEWVLDAAAAAAHAHEAGIIHRDIKPSNVMLTDDDRVKLIDFGLAVHHGERTGALTRTGVFIGSHNYAAPEQLRGEKALIGPWTDVYGLAATLYEMLTGAAPFSFATFVARIDAADSLPSRAPHEVNAKVSKALSRAVMAGLAVRAKKRPADAIEWSVMVRKASV